MQIWRISIVVESVTYHSCLQKKGSVTNAKGLAITFKSFVRPICEYGNVAIMGAAASHLSTLDAVQKRAEKLSDCTFPSLHSRREASAVGLLCKLLDFRGRGPLQQFFPSFATTPLTHSYSLRNLSDDPLLLSSSIKYNSLDLYRRSFLGAITNIWASTPHNIRLRGSEEDWYSIIKLLQKYLCSN